MALALVLVLPVLGAVVIGAAGWRPWSAWAAVGANGALLGVGIALSVHIVDQGTITGAWNVLRADALSAFMILVIGAIAGG